jgi:hypothetical protein
MPMPLAPRLRFKSVNVYAMPAFLAWTSKQDAHSTRQRLSTTVSTRIGNRPAQRAGAQGTVRGGAVSRTTEVLPTSEDGSGGEPGEELPSWNDIPQADDGVDQAAERRGGDGVDNSRELVATDGLRSRQPPSRCEPRHAPILLGAVRRSENKAARSLRSWSC